MHKRSKILLAGFLGASLIASVIAYGKYDGIGFHAQKRLTHSLQLTPLQSIKLEQLVAHFKDSGRRLRQDHFLNTDEILELLEDEQLDQQKALEMVRSRLVAIEQQAALLIKSTAEFTNSLDHEQRKTLKNLAGTKLSLGHSL